MADISTTIYEVYIFINVDYTGSGMYTNDASLRKHAMRLRTHPTPIFIRYLFITDVDLFFSSRLLDSFGNI